MGLMDRIKEEASSAIAATMDTSPRQVQPASQQQVQQQQEVPQRQEGRRSEKPIPHYVVLQVTLKEKMIGTGSGNLSELERAINQQASRGYRLHTISTASGGSAGFAGGDRIQATMVFEEII